MNSESAPPLEGSAPDDDRYRPFIAVWEVTLACDLACRHCGSRASAPRQDELSTAEALNLISQLADLGVREVALIGGEVYLRRDWPALIRAIRAAGMTPTLVTGGRRFTPARAHTAAHAGLGSVSVSIDGEEPTHDRLRAVAGSHRAAFVALANLRAAGVPVGVNTQVNRLSWPDLPHVLERVADAGASAWQLQLTVPMGRAADEPELLLQPHDLLPLFPLLESLAARCAELGVLFAIGNNIGYFGPHHAVLRGQVGTGHAAGCGAGMFTLGIEADGTIKGCPSLASATWTGGNVRQTPLRDIWERARALRYTRHRTTADLWGYCATCYYADECRAGLLETMPHLCPSYPKQRGCVSILRHGYAGWFLGLRSEQARCAPHHFARRDSRAGCVGRRWNRLL